MNKQIRKKKRGLDNALSRQILFQYLLSLLAYCIGLPLICLLGVMIVSSRTWYGTELIYPFLDWVRNYFQLLFLIALIVGLLFITVYFIRKPLRFIDNLVEASQQLAREPTRPIELPELLSPVADRLNAVRQDALRSEAAMREAEQRKNDLIVYLAHDLKTPLTSVIGYLTLLRDEPQISPELRARYTGIALDKAERLEELINEFFEITRFNLSHLTLELTTVDLTRMLEQTCSEFEPSFAEKHLRYTLELPPQMPCECDPDKLARVFDNLLRNANFYSFPDTEIRVSGEETRGLITLRFENSGPTIPREKLDRIFEQFFRLDSSRSSASGGAGLGLAIAKEFVRLHGGSICAASEDNRIVFTVTLPRSQTPPPPSP